MFLLLAFLAVEGSRHLHAPLSLSREDKEMTRWTVAESGRTVFLNDTNIRNESGRLILRKQLSAAQDAPQVLMIRTARQRVDIFLDGQALYRYPESPVKKVYWEDILFVPLPGSGGVLELHLDNEYGEIGGWNPLSYAAVGDPAVLSGKFLMGALLNGISGGILTGLGLYLLISTRRSRIKSVCFERQGKARLALSHWICALGMQYLANNGLLKCFINLPALGYLIRLYMGCAISVFIFSFLYNAFAFRYRKVYRVFQFMQIAVMTGIFVLGIFWDAVLAHGMTILGLNALLYSTVCSFVMAMEAVRNPPLRSVGVVGCILFFITAVNAMTPITALDSPQKITLLSTVLFMGWLIWATGGRIESLRQEALEKEMLDRQLNRQLKHYETLHELSEQRWILYHDLRHHLRVMQAIYQSGDAEQSKWYYEQVMGEYEKQGDLIHTHNPVLDAILNEAKRSADKKGIDFTCDIEMGGELSVRPLDWCAMAGNALENALEGCGETGRRTIHLRIRQQQSLLVLEIVNTVPVQGKKELRDELPHGYGQKSIRSAAALYGGTMEIRQTPGEYRLRIFLPNLTPGAKAVPSSDGQKRHTAC